MCIAFPIRSRWCLVQRRWASGHSEAVRAVPRYPPGRGSSWERAPIWWPPIETCASRVRSASSLHDFFWMVILHFPTFRRMPDHAMNCSTISSSAIMSSMVLTTSMPSSAYHLLANRRSHDSMSYSLCVVVSQRMRGPIMRSKRSGDRGSPCSVPRRIPTRDVCPWGLINSVVAPLYKLEIMVMKSPGSPRNVRIRTSCSWSAEGNAPLKSG